MAQNIEGVETYIEEVKDDGLITIGNKEVE